MAKYLRYGMAIILAIAIIISCTVMGNKLTDPSTYAHTIEVLDKNRTTVLGLSAASAVASAAVSYLPGDMCSSIAEQLSEISSWFMMILGFLYLEKYLLTILGAAACYILIPIGCSALIINCFFPKGTLQSIGIKLVAFGVAMLLVIPTSVWISDQINATYSKSIEMTVQSADAVSNHLTNEVTGEDDEQTTLIDEAKAMLSDIVGSVAKVIGQFKNLLNRFIEATAVMIVTTCLIPILVVLFFMWLVKTLFNIPISVSPQMLKPKKINRSRNENELQLSE